MQCFHCLLQLYDISPHKHTHTHIPTATPTHPLGQHHTCHPLLHTAHTFHLHPKSTPAHSTPPHATPTIYQLQVQVHLRWVLAKSESDYSHSCYKNMLQEVIKRSYQLLCFNHSVKVKFVWQMSHLLQVLQFWVAMLCISQGIMVLRDSICFVILSRIVAWVRNLALPLIFRLWAHPGMLQ